MLACCSMQVKCPVCAHTHRHGRPFRENTFFPQREQFLAATADKLLNFTPIPLPHTHALHNSEGRHFSPADPAPSSESSMEIMRTPSPSQVCGDEPDHCSSQAGVGVDSCAKPVSALHARVAGPTMFPPDVEDSPAHAQTHNGGRTVVSIDLLQARQTAAPTHACDSRNKQRPTGEQLSYVDSRQVALQRIAAYSQVSPRRSSGSPAHTATC